MGAGRLGFDQGPYSCEKQYVRSPQREAEMSNTVVFAAPCFLTSGAVHVK